MSKAEAKSNVFELDGLKLPDFDTPHEVDHAQLQTSITLANFLNSTLTLNQLKTPGIKMYVYQGFLVIFYNNKVAATPNANLVSIILK